MNRDSLRSSPFTRPEASITSWKKCKKCRITYLRTTNICIDLVVVRRHSKLFVFVYKLFNLYLSNVKQSIWMMTLSIFFCDIFYVPFSITCNPLVKIWIEFHFQQVCVCLPLCPTVCFMLSHIMSRMTVAPLRYLGQVLILSHLWSCGLHLLTPN